MYTKARSYKSLLLEYGRFLVTGILNTATDFLILNGLLFLFSRGPEVSKPTYVAFKTISFLGAITQSYALNKHWVFGRARTRGAASTKGYARERGMFLAVSALGFGINIAAAGATFAALGHMGMFDQRIDANIGALAGTALTLITNFVGYKFLVFKRHEPHLSVGGDTRIQGIQADQRNAP